MLDGEFAIVVVDYANGTALYSTDVFGTKPLWIGLGSKANDEYARSLVATNSSAGSAPPAIGVATYPSALEGLGFKRSELTQVLPNTATVVSLDAPYRTLSTRRLYEFDLRQHKSTVDDWDKAFNEALRKRVQHVKFPVFVALSGGYDSGLISAGLMGLGFKHHTITIVGDREDEIVYRRNELCGDLCMPKYFHLSVQDIRHEREYIATSVEPFEYDIPEPGTVRDRDGKGKGKGQSFKHYVVAQDEASVGVSTVMKLARESGILVYLSGGGVDEIVTDYGFHGKPRYGHYSQSSFAGLFPGNLSDIYPWSNFFAGTQRAYLMKEEHVGGSHGVETRYPFLDVALVQEFLWLTADYKNAVYKHPLDEVLTRKGYPFTRGHKMGFHISPCWRSLEPIVGIPLWVGPVDPFGCGPRGIALVASYISLAASAVVAAAISIILYKRSSGTMASPLGKTVGLIVASSWELRRRKRLAIAIAFVSLATAAVLLVVPSFL